MNYEILNDAGDVTNSIVADQAFMDRNYAGRYRLLSAEPEPEPAPIRRLDPLEFRQRFTHAEKVSIYTAAEHAPEIRVFLDDLAVAKYIDLDDPETAFGVHALEAAGLIATGRSAEILA